MSNLSLDELHLQMDKIKLVQNAKNPKMYDFALEQPDGSFNKVTITNNIETKENGQIIIDLNHIAKKLPYSGSEPNKDCDMKQRRNITGRAIADRIQNREIPYIRILQPCNNITGAENRCYYLFEAKEGQSPIRVISNYEVEKLLWPNTQCRWICGQHYVMFDGKIVYQCTQIEPWGWKLVLQDEPVWFTEDEITCIMTQANVSRKVAIEALLKNNNVVDTILDLVP